MAPASSSDRLPSRAACRSAQALVHGDARAAGRRVAPTRRHLLLSALSEVARAAPADLDLPRLRPLGHGQRESQNAVLITGGDVLGVDRRAEPELAAEAALRTLADQELVALVLFEASLGGDCQNLGFRP